MSEDGLNEEITTVNPSSSPSKDPHAVDSIKINTPSYCLTFADGQKSATITLTGGKVAYQGDLPIAESADLFFRHVLMKWRDFNKDEDYANARLAALEAGYSESDRIAAVVRDLADTREVWRLVLETIRYEAKSDDSERMQRVLKMVERTLAIKP